MNLTYTTGAHGSRHSGGQLHFDEGVTVVETYSTGLLLNSNFR